MINRCDDCAHSNVCIYKQKYQENYTTLEKESKYDKPFSIKLDCEEYEPRNYNLRFNNNKELKIDTNPFPYNIVKTSDPCEGCGVYEDMKKGKITINDACTFCSKTPLKIGGSV